ncbi:MAG: DUF2834 domain-containing protein [Leptolyngbyaceae cyanobacterium SL_7_1]|nr:DUF2834 domain-containing protein [Leptolyngbyaceae cyanobacterium SL_7_1]
MIGKIGFWLLWIGFIAYASLLAPPNDPDTIDLITELSTGRWDGINPLVIALFNIMGVFPMIYSSVLLLDGRGQKTPAWIFVVGSFAVGAFAILPYLALRRPNPTFVGEKNWLLKWLDSRWNGIALTLGSIGLLVYGLTAGNWADFVQQWQSSRFIHVMSLDFCLLCLLFPTLLPNDRQRRGLHQRDLLWVISCVPLVGAALYLALRPSILSQAAPTSPVLVPSQGD